MFPHEQDNIISGSVKIIARLREKIKSFYLDSSGQICYYSVKVDYDGAQFEVAARLTHNVILQNNIKGNFV